MPRNAAVNSEVYAQLGERWYQADDDPVALLRAQARLHVPWISSYVHARFPEQAAPRSRRRLQGGVRRQRAVRARPRRRLFVRNVPRDLHVLRLFIRPSELRATCAAHGLSVEELFGCRPERSRALLRMLVTGVVPRDFAFRFSRSTLTGYSGVARKRDHFP